MQLGRRDGTDRVVRAVFSSGHRREDIWPTTMLLAAATAFGALATAATAAAPACTDTPDWNNRCADKGCSPGQFPFGKQPGYFSPTPAPGGWTCKMYGYTGTGGPKWCNNGVLVVKSAGGEKFNDPERNCCVCGKGRPQPPLPPPPLPPPPTPPPPPPPMVADGVLCGGACSDGMVLDRANATVWGVGAKSGTKITATLAGTSWTAVVGSDGGWSLSLGAQPPSTGHTLSFAGSDSTFAKLTDVAFGDVSKTHNLLCVLQFRSSKKSTLDDDSGRSWGLFRSFFAADKAIWNTLWRGS